MQNIRLKSKYSHKVQELGMPLNQKHALNIPKSELLPDQDSSRFSFQAELFNNPNTYRSSRKTIVRQDVQ